MAPYAAETSNDRPRLNRMNSARNERLNKAKFNQRLGFQCPSNYQGLLALLVFWSYLHLCIWRTQKMVEDQLKSFTSIDQMVLLKVPPTQTSKKADETVDTVLNMISLRKDGDQMIGSNHTSEENNKGVDTANPLPQEATEKFILFSGKLSGQGEGNIINGLLAAHLFGAEFNRTVCITDNWHSFNVAFRSKNAMVCRQLPYKTIFPTESYLNVVNYNTRPADECHIRETLASDQDVITLHTNTYPRWPAVPANFFSTYYEPTEALKLMLPWKEPPEVVVHLRQSDGGGDVRDGLSNETLDLLGKVLPTNTFLVTNAVSWYDGFEKKYGWRNPGWDRVQHSGNGIDFSKRNITKGRRAINFVWSNVESMPHKDAEFLQLYSDWYTILCARKVYHTHSDFSLFAVHFMNVDSKTIMGTKEASNDELALELWDEPWNRGEVPERLINRSRDELQNCGV